MTLNWIYHNSDDKRCWREPDCIICYLKCFFWLLYKTLKIKLSKKKSKKTGASQRTLAEALCPFAEYCPYINTESGCIECMHFIEGNYIYKLKKAKSKDSSIDLSSK